MVRFVLLPWLGHERVICGVLVAAAVLHVVIAERLSRLGPKSSHAVTSFTLTALAVLVVSLRSAVAIDLVTPVIWSGVALGLWVIALRWKNHDVHALSFVVQVYAFGFTAVVGMLSTVKQFPLIPFGVLLALGALCIVHFAGCRRVPTDRATGLFHWIDPSDRMAIIVLLTGLAFAFCAIRLALYSSVTTSNPREAAAVFHCGQTVVVNLCALVLAVLGLRVLSGELMAVAVALAVIGAGKMFAFDFLNAHGTPLVINVFVFGVTAAAGSVIWTRWQKQPKPADQ